MTTNPTTFGALVRAHRARLGLGLREFCTGAGMDPAYLSRIERGVLPPPKDLERLAELAGHLGIAEQSPEWRTFADQAAIDAGNLPADILNDEKMLRKVPVLFRTIRGQKLTEAKLRELIEFLRDK